tara:strand:+ start:49 stop:564 length:516 start_codon:yes stop_codon:yes gene_type:complete
MNYSNSSSLICDYITLFFEDATISNGVAEWSVPASSYYFQDRGPICLVSLADGIFNPNTGDDGLIIGYNGMNGSVAQEGSTDLIKNDVALLGTFQQASNVTMTEGCFVYMRTEPIKLLTQARPNKIRLYFFKAINKNEFDVDSGCVTLKFEYLSPEAVKEINSAVSYTPAF